MECIILSELTAVLESHHFISTHQFGFHKNHSTTHLLVEAVHYWAKALECHDHSIHCLFLDFAKAFDSVPHHRLLLKLQSLGVSDTLKCERQHLLEAVCYTSRNKELTQ